MIRPRHVCILALSIALIAAADQMGPPQPSKDLEIAKESVRKLHSYDSFQNRLHVRTKLPSLATEAHYDEYVTIQAEEYRRRFTPEELAKLAEFLGTPLGQRFMSEQWESRAWEEFLRRGVPTVVSRERVTMKFDDDDVRGMVPFLMGKTGRLVLLHPELYGRRFSLHVKEEIELGEAISRIFDKLAEDRIDVRFTDDAIVITPLVERPAPEAK